VARAKRSFFSSPTPTGRLDDLLLGRNIVDGSVKLLEPLKSPIRSQPCAAFVYEAALVITGMRGTVVHKLKHVSAYAPFALAMEGGTLRVEPEKTDLFTQQDHLALGREHQGKNVQAAEQLVTAGTRVRLRGVLREEPDGTPVLAMKSLEVLEKPKAGAAAKKRGGLV
jgi:hypothetical protein